jgi:hypothetical protein
LLLLARLRRRNSRLLGRLSKSRFQRRTRSARRPRKRVQSNLRRRSLERAMLLRPLQLQHLPRLQPPRRRKRSQRRPMLLRQVQFRGPRVCFKIS